MQTQSQITIQRNHDDLHIYLNSKQGLKLLGIVAQDALRIFRDERKHYFRAMAGYGLNSELLRDPKRFPFRWIELTIQHPDGLKEHHRISRDKWLAEGIRWMHFQNCCESQFILPLSIIRGETAKPDFASHPIQQNLFGVVP
jgi:hypothetical protein